MRKTLILAAVVAIMTIPTAALAKLSAKINLSRQTMTVYENGKQTHSWKISSGKDGYFTPTGSFKPYIVKKMHYSKKYDNAPMPYSVFFRGGYAVHGTKAVWRLGRPASHGCVRLQTSNAKKFHDLVNKYGKAATSIRVVGSTPSKTVIRVTSASKVTLLRSRKNKVRHMRRSSNKRSVYSASSRKAKLTNGKNTRRATHTARNSRYSAHGFNSASWKKYAARMRRKQASR